MPSKNKSNSIFVYSTDPSFNNVEEQQGELPQISNEEQKIRVLLDKKQRAGKAVTLVTGYQASEEALQELGKKLKTFCGCGGAVKNGEIIVQGDNREKIFNWLKNNGFKHIKLN